MISAKRFNNILLLLRVVCRAVFVGRADKLPKNIKRIIVVPTGKLGDVVCTTPVFAALRKHFPQAKIISIGDYKLHEKVLMNSGLVDEYLPMATGDVAILIGPSFELAAPLYLAGVPLISTPHVLGGFSDQVTRPYKVLEKFLANYDYRIGKYAPRERLHSLEPLGIIEDDTTKHLGFSKQAAEKVSSYFASGKFVVGLTPTAGHKVKEWPEERFAEVADYLIDKYKAKVFVIGGPNDGVKVNRVIDTMKHKAGASVVTNLNIDELKAFISRLNLFISVDTGPIYIAEAFGIPTIDITGPIDENEQPPQGLMHRNVVPKERVRPELFVLNAKTYNKQEAMRQVDSISVSMVTNEIDSLIPLIRKNSG